MPNRKAYTGNQPKRYGNKLSVVARLATVDQTEKSTHHTSFVKGTTTQTQTFPNPIIDLKAIRHNAVPSSCAFAILLIALVSKTVSLKLVFALASAARQTLHCDLQ